MKSFPCVDCAFLKGGRRATTHFVKAFIAFVVLLFVAIGGAAGYWVWNKMNRIEDRGIGLVMANPVPQEQIERAEAQYNLILDREEVLRTAVKENELMDYYEVSTEEEAITKLRDETFIDLPGGRNLHLLFTGKRFTRDLREQTTRTMARSFLEVMTKENGQAPLAP